MKSYGVYAKTPKGQKSITPNFTRLSMTNLPQQTAGRKGGKPAPKKTIARRKTVPYDQRQQRLSLDSHTASSSPITVTSITMSQSPQTDVVVPSGSWNWNHNETQHISPLSNKQQQFWMPYASYPSYLPPPPPPPSGFLPFSDITNYCPPSPYDSVSKSSNTYDITPCSSKSILEPFLVKKLNGRIKVCAGCKGPHRKTSDNEVLSPPHDICLGHRELLSFVNPRNGLECSKLGNAYYHINLDCIRRKHPNFTSAQIVCPPDLQGVLTEVHYSFLWEAIGYCAQN